MEEGFENLVEITENTDVILFGSFLKDDKIPNDLDFMAIGNDAEDMEKVKRAVYSIDWPVHPDPIFMSETQFERRCALKDFKFSSALKNYDSFGQNLNLEGIEQDLYEEAATKEALKFNFFRSLNNWDKADLFLKQAKNYSRRKTHFESFSPEAIYDDRIQNFDISGIKKSLLDSSASLSFATGYLAATTAYAEGKTSYTKDDAFSEPRSDLEQLFFDVKSLQWDQKDKADYQPELLEEYVDETRELLESSEFNSLFEEDY